MSGAMIVNVGKRIKIKVGNYHFERDADGPGVVTVADTRLAYTTNFIRLPGNPDDAEEFIAAYRRALAEDIDYRKSEVERA